MSLNPLSIATEGYVVSGGSLTALNIAALGYQVSIEITDIVPKQTPWPSYIPKKKVMVTIIRDGITYTDWAYTEKMDVTAEDVEITVTKGNRPTVLFNFPTTNKK